MGVGAGLPAGGAAVGFAGEAVGFGAAVGAPGFAALDAGFAAGATDFEPEEADPLVAAGFVAALGGVFEASDLISDFAGWFAVEGLTASFSLVSLTGSFCVSWALCGVSGALV